MSRWPSAPVRGDPDLRESPVDAALRIVIFKERQELAQKGVLVIAATRIGDDEDLGRSPNPPKAAAWTDVSSPAMDTNVRIRACGWIITWRWETMGTAWLFCRARRRAATWSRSAIGDPIEHLAGVAQRRHQRGLGLIVGRPATAVQEIQRPRDGAGRRQLLGGEVAQDDGLAGTSAWARHRSQSAQCSLQAER